MKENKKLYKICINNKKGFTLVELLAVIVILAVLALILVPTITGIIISARKAAFKSSVQGIIKSADAYVAQEILLNQGSFTSTTFVCNGSDCSNENAKLEFNGKIPTGGSVLVEGEQDVAVDKITNGEFCASGTNNDLKVVENCLFLDETIPDINLTMQLQSTSNSIIATLPANYALDVESEVVRYIFELSLDGNIEQTQGVDFKNETISVRFSSLKSETTYNIKVRIINGNDMENSEVKTIKTGSIVNPTITFVSDPENAINEYRYSQVAKVVFSNQDFSNPSYYIKSSRNALTSIGVTESCGTDVIPGECSNIETITTIMADIWYKVSGDVDITYNEGSITNGILYATSSDGINYAGGVTATLSKIFISSEDVTYTTPYNSEIDNVKEALDDLYKYLQ